MNALEQLLIKYQSNHLRITARVIMAFISAFILWAMLAHLEEYAVAEGEVVPQEQIQAVQHLEGGIIEKLHVLEGDRVEKDQALIQLNLTPFLANKDELEIQLQSLQLKKARLEAESSGKDDFTYISSFDSFRENLKKAEMQAFAGRQEQLANDIAQLKEQLSQRELDRQQLVTERASIARNLGVLREKFRISSDLVKDKLTSRLDHLQLSSELKELEGRIQVIDVAIPRASAAIKEAHDKLDGARVTFRNRALQELGDVEQAISRLKENLNRATDQVARTTITSPITGIVKSLRTHTIGGVVQPGEVLMEIVPESDNLIIEAKLNPNDIGFVTKGQRALVKVNTYDYARYGGLEGEVIHVSADSLLDKQQGLSYFLVKIRTDQNHLGTDENRLPISSGMQVSADIKTGTKSVMAYLLKPIIKLTSESFRER